MRSFAVLFICGITISLAGVACEDQTPLAPGAQITKDGQQVFIVDRTGKRWDVTHAQQKYGMRAENFEFGLGPDAIRPINNPRMLSPGDPNYPASNLTFLVLGATLAGRSRAYPINIMSMVEIANERFGNQFVAVGY